MANCSSCGAPIVWVKTPLGKMMPLDEKLIRYKQNPEGKDFLVSDRGETIRCDLVFEGLPTGMARRSHFVTCPNADKFRKRGRKA